MRDFNLRVYEPLPTAEGFSTNPATVLPAYLADVTSLVTGFPRTIGEEGDLDGVIVLQGEGEIVTRLMAWFDAWVGVHIEERAGGKTYEGLAYKLEFIYRGDRDMRALFGVPDDQAVWNAVKMRYTAPSITESNELATNGGFELAGQGSAADIFFAWAENAGSGTIVRDTAVKNSGAASCRITFGGAGGQHIIQYLPLRGGQSHQFSFYTRGDGSVGGSYQVRDSTNAAAIISLTATGVTGTTWTLVSVDFTVPTTCREVEIYLLGPGSAGSAYFDDVSLKQYQDTLLETDWFTNDASIARYARREIIKNVGKTNLGNAEKEAARYLSQRSWPTAVPVSTDASQKDNPTATLVMHVIGYIATATYRYVTGLNGKRFDLSIEDIVDNFCDFLIPARLGKGEEISGTGDLLSQDELPEGRALEVIRLLVGKGTSSGLPMIFSVLNRRANYVQLNVNPTYYRRNGRLSLTTGGSVSVSPRQVRPGVVRRMDYPVGGRESGSLLLDRRDMYVSAVQVDESGNLRILNIGSLAESEITVWEDRTRPVRVQPPPIGTDGGQEFPASVATADEIAADIANEFFVAGGGWRMPQGPGLPNPPIG